MKIWKSLLLILSTAIILSGTSMAASVSKIETSQKSLDYQVVRAHSDGEFHNGLLFAMLSDESFIYYNINGQQAFSISDNLIAQSDFSEQRAIVKDKRTNLYGYINTIGQLVIPCSYSEVGNFTDGVAYVKNANTMEKVLIDRFGKIISTLNSLAEINSFSEGLAVSYDNEGDKIGYINKSGELTIPYIYTDARTFTNGLALTQNNKGWYGYIDTKGNTIIPFKYKSAGYFSNGGLAPAENSNGKWGFIDKRGKTVIPFQYYNAGNFSEGLASVSNSKGMIGFINTSGKLVINYLPYTKSSEFKEGIVLVGKGSGSSEKFGYIDRSGKLLTKMEYTFESSDFYQGVAVGIKISGGAVLLTKSTLLK